MKSCRIWYSGHGCRDWFRCKNGAHPRFVWKDPFTKQHHGRDQHHPGGWYDLLQANFCRTNLRHPSTNGHEWIQCCREEVVNDRTGCHRLHMCTQFTPGSFLHEDNRWYMPFSWMSSLDPSYKLCLTKDDRYDW